jgi:hypothetical protein
MEALMRKTRADLLVEPKGELKATVGLSSRRPKKRCRRPRFGRVVLALIIEARFGE